ncbi:MAG: SusD/RagB family nutrient-binding outer membrane lipoprotein [Cytophagales bacterium]|nr:SusD/RagB family nutrient-binding outer membrane lipoprotein [Cytophagales bacterium]
MKKSYFLLLLIPGLCFGCEDWLDINDDPNSPVDVEAPRILPAAQVNTAFVVSNDLHRQTSTLVQHYAGLLNQILAYDEYDFNGTEADASWRFGIYAGALLDFQRIIEISEPNGDRLFQGISKVYMAYLFSVVTDLYDEVPFEDALKDIEIIAPGFDPQETVYDGILAMLDDAIVDLSADNPGASPGASDIIYGGDPASWIKVANTMKIKFWMQIRKRRPTQAQAAINQLLGQPIFESNADNFSSPFGTTNGNQHTMYDFAFNRRAQDIAISQRFIDSLEVLNDPRIEFYFDDNGQDEFIGYDNGGTATVPQEDEKALLGVFPVGQNGEAPQRMLTYYALQFYLAEADLVLDITGDARDYYEEALETAMSHVGVEDADAQTYITDRLATYDAAADNEARLAIVMRDKWVASFGNGLEAYNDWRRTGYPRLLPSTTPLTPDGSIPRRLLYSSNELSSNPNLENQAQLIQRVWWDVQ